MRTIAKMLGLYALVLVIAGCGYWVYYQLSWPQAAGCPSEDRDERVEFPATITAVRPAMFQGSFDALPASIEMRDDNGKVCTALVDSHSWGGPGVGSHIRVKIQVHEDSYGGYLEAKGWQS